MPIGDRPIVAKPKQTLKLWQLYFSVINHQLDLFSNQVLSDYLVYTKAIRQLIASEQIVNSGCTLIDYHSAHRQLVLIA